MGTPEGHGVEQDGVQQQDAVQQDSVQQEHGALGRLSADEELQQAVCGALIGQGDLDSTRIEVRAAQGIVVLTGSVRSREDWMHALRIARRQAGARSVQTDQLAIRDA